MPTISPHLCGLSLGQPWLAGQLHFGYGGCGDGDPHKSKFGGRAQSVYHTLVSELHRRHHPWMSKPAAAASPPKSIEFHKGQVWRIGELNLAVVLVGKLLVHYKKYRAQRKGVRTTMTSHSDLRKYLLSGGAVLAATEGGRRHPPVLQKRSSRFICRWPERAACGLYTPRAIVTAKRFPPPCWLTRPPVSDGRFHK